MRGNMTGFKNWIDGFEHRYSEDELWTMRWAFEVGARFNQPSGTFVDPKNLINDCVYKHVLNDEYILIKENKPYLMNKEGLKLTELDPNQKLMRLDERELEDRI